MRISILGAGAWGTALAINLTARHEVRLWARDAAQVAVMQADRSNQRYLPNLTFPAALQITTDFYEACRSAELILIAVPIAALRETLQQIVGVAARAPVVWVCKGFEANTAQLPHQVVAEVFPPDHLVGVLSGPSFAQEVARGLPTALTLAASDGGFAKRIAQALHHSHLRIYSSTDVIGVEVGGAVKNVLAIAAGIAEGLGLGYNARAALITRGLAEITRLGLMMGGRAETLGGLSGAGDLILTCTGQLSRNRQVGMLLAKQHALPDILQELGHVAEGVYTVREVQQLARQLKINMPICAAVYSVLYGQISAAQALEDLLSRAPSAEFEE